MIPGIFVNGSSAVLAAARGAAGTATRRGHSAPLLPRSLVSRAGAYGRTVRPPGRATGRAVTIHSPGLMPRTSAVTATGPLPGMTPSAVISCVKVSPGLGFPVTPSRRPENQTVTRNGSPLSPGSSQKVGVRTFWSARSAQSGISSAVAPDPAAGRAAAGGAGAATGARAAGPARRRPPACAGRPRLRFVFFGPPSRPPARLAPATFLLPQRRLPQPWAQVYLITLG